MNGCCFKTFNRFANIYRQLKKIALTQRSKTITLGREYRQGKSLSFEASYPYLLTLAKQYGNREKCSGKQGRMSQLQWLEIYPLCIISCRQDLNYDRHRGENSPYQGRSFICWEGTRVTKQVPLIVRSRLKARMHRGERCWYRTIYHGNLLKTKGGIAKQDLGPALQKLERMFRVNTCIFCCTGQELQSLSEHSESRQWALWPHSLKVASTVLTPLQSVSHEQFQNLPVSPDRVATMLQGWMSQDPKGM